MAKGEILRQAGEMEDLIKKQKVDNMDFVTRDLEVHDDDYNKILGLVVPYGTLAAQAHLRTVL